MKKLNLNNETSNDDEKLIELLKTSIIREPSIQFTESTLEKFLAFKAKPKKAYKPLKLPLYIILCIGLMLLTPVFLTLSKQTPLTPSEFKLKNIIESISFKINSWYIISTTLLLLVSTVWIKLSLFKFRSPFL